MKNADFRFGIFLLIFFITILGLATITWLITKDLKKPIIEVTARDSSHVVTTEPIIVSSNAEILRILRKDSLYKDRVEKLLGQLKAENKQLKSLLIYNTNTLVQLADNDSSVIINNFSDFNYHFADTIYPTYKRELDKFGEWIKGTITLGYDTINLDLRLKNSFNVTTGYRGMKQYVDIESLNPYTKTEDVRYYMHRASRFSLGIGFGIYGDPFMKRAGFGFNAGVTFKLL